MILRPLSLAALLVTIALTGACSSGSADSRPTASGPTNASRPQPLLVTSRCPDLVVLGARGSTQSLDLNDGVGREVLVSVEALARRLQDRSDTTVQVEAVPYDASASPTAAGYSANVRSGARLLTGLASSIVRDCPRTRLAMVGFSQGAQVVHGFAADVPSTLAPRVALVAMIADPLRNPDDDIVSWDYGQRPLSRPGRIGAGALIDPAVSPVTISLCVADDEICNAKGSPGTPPSATHRHFYERPASSSSTADQLDRILRKSGL